MHDFLLENSWTYRQSVEQSIEKGIRESIERVVQARFPVLAQLVKECIERIQDQEILLQALVAMSTAETEKKARHYLLALKMQTIRKSFRGKSKEEACRKSGTLLLCSFP